MKKRIVIAALPDGHITVDKQQLSYKKISGNAHQRRIAKASVRRGGVELEWIRSERKIFRTGTVELPAASENVMLLPLSSAEIRSQAIYNEQLAAEGIDFAKQITWAHRRLSEAFTVKTPKAVRVIIEEVE